MKYTAIIAASGNSIRFNNKDKLLCKINNEKIIVYSVNNFIEDKDCEKIIILTSNKNYELFKKMFCLYNKILVITGEKTRFKTVKKGVEYLNKNSEYVLIHDGARPYLSFELLNNIKQELFNNNLEAVIPSIEVFDSMYNVSKQEYVNRQNYRLIQTPQAFKVNILKKSYLLNQEYDLEFNDEFSLVYKYIKNIKYKFIDGDPKNKKITIQEDL